MAVIWISICAYIVIFANTEAQTLSLSVTPSSPVVGQEVTFTCTASQDITATTTLYYRRDDAQVVEITVNSTSCSTVKTQVGKNYVITCGSLPLQQLSLTIPAAYVTEDEHGTNWRCEIFFGAESDSVNLTLSVPVTTVTMTTNGVYQPSVRISAGNTRTFTCTTTASRPVASISWIRGGNNITDQASTATDQDVGEDKYTRQQSLTITGRVNDVDSGLRCEGVNIEGRTPVSSPTSNISVQWEPQTDPTLTRAPPTTTLTEGVSVTLTCQQIGGKPLAILSWSGVCGGTTPTQSSDTTTITSSVQLSVNRTYNGQTCICESRHLVNGYLRLISETFIVLFGPDTVTITGNKQIVADGVRELTLACVTSSYHQYVKLTWKRGNSLLSGASGPSNTSTADGTVTSQALILTPDRTWDGDTISCTAERIGTTIQAKGSVQLDLLYLPETDVLVGGYDQNTKLTETSVVSMYCTVRGGKPVPTLTFTCPGIRVTPTLGTDGMLHYSNITFPAVRQLNGQQCSCTGSQPNDQWTSIGKSHALFVLFGPDTVSITGNKQTVSDGVRDLILTCVTSPYHQFVTLTWKRGNSLLTGASSPANTSTTDGTLTSQVLTLTPDRTWDGDTISCTAETIGTTIQAKGSVQLDLLYGPGTTVALSPADTTYIKTEGGTLPDITCTADCRPDCTFVWTKPDNTNFTTSPVLSLGQLDKSKHGTYTCTARNDISQSTTAILVAVHHRPAQPVKLVISQLTSSSVALSWEPGNEQRSYDTFRLAYQKHEDISTTSVTLNKTTTAFTIGQLLPSTQYDVFVTAVYLGGISEALSGAFVTPELHNTGVCPLSENAGNAGVTLIAVASVMILLNLLIFAVAIIMLRKGRLQYVKHTAKDKSRSANKTHRSADIGEFGLERYEDLNLEQIESPSEYQEVTNNTPDNDNNTAGNTSNVYEHLRQQSTADVYEDIPPKPETGSSGMYVNTAPN